MHTHTQRHTKASVHGNELLLAEQHVEYKMKTFF